MELRKFASLEHCQLIDKLTIENTPISADILMENAGNEMGQAICQYYPGENSFFILCGTGNNGGDGLVLARFLAKKGHQVKVGILSKHFDTGSNLFKLNLKRLKFFKVPVICGQYWKDFSRYKNIPNWVDAIYGTGLNRPLAPNVSKIIARINVLAGNRIALDIPTGLSLYPEKSPIIKADLTLTVHLYKDIYLYPWLQIHLGQLIPITIDFPKAIVDKYSRCLHPYTLVKPDKEEISHKTSKGRTMVFAGSGKYPGAACLCSKAAISNGTSYLYLVSPQANCDLDPEIIHLKTFERQIIQAGDFKRYKSEIDHSKHILLGPGWDRHSDTTEFMKQFIQVQGKNIVVDADALWHVRPLLNSKPWGEFIKKNKVLLTPHLGEFANLMSKTTDEIKTDFLRYLDRAKELAPHILVKDAFLFLWGSNNYYFPFPNRYLAKAGSGDILSGYILASLNLYDHFETAIIQGILKYIQAGKNVRNRYGVDSPISLMLNPYDHTS